MKYLESKFSSPANSKAYVDGWERVFGEEPSLPERVVSDETRPQAPDAKVIAMFRQMPDQGEDE